MISRKPEGYKDLLVYKKAAEIQSLTLKLTDLFPKTKTLLSLKDQMDRSARSGTKNIIEGWKRNTTREYFQFLGFSIGSLEELKDDCKDISLGLYRELMGVRGVMGKIGEAADPFIPIVSFSEFELNKLSFYPLDETLPPAVQLYLRCKEVLMFLDKLQKSLDLKMDKEGTKSVTEKYRQRLAETKNYNKWLLEETKKLGLVRLEDGRFMKKEKNNNA